MYLSAQDLQNINEDLLRSLPRKDLVEVSILFVEDLKEAHDRLNQNPSNSSRPPSSKDPWVIVRLEKEDNEDGSSDDDPVEEPSDSTGLSGRLRLEWVADFTGIHKNQSQP